MNFQQRYAIKRNFQYLLEECSVSSLVNNLLDRLFSNELIEKDEYEILIRMTIAREKMRSLLSFMLDKRGQKYRDLYKVFLIGLTEDMDRPDIIETLSITFNESPVGESDTLSIDSEDRRYSMTSSFDSTHNPHHSATYNYNYFYSCPDFLELPQLTPSRQTRTLLNTRRKSSLDSILLAPKASFSTIHTLHTDSRSSWAENSLNEIQELVRREEKEFEKSGERGRIYKIVIVGASGVGKSSLIRQYSIDSDHYEETVKNEYERTLNIGNDRIKVVVFDVSCSQESYTVKTSFNMADGVIMVYDVTSMESLLYLISWHDVAKTHTRKQACYMMIANKCDLPDRQVSTEHGKMIADHLGIETFVDQCIASHPGARDFVAEIASVIYQKNSPSFSPEIILHGNKKKHRRRNHCISS